MTGFICLLIILLILICWKTPDAQLHTNLRLVCKVNYDYFVELINSPHQSPDATGLLHVLNSISWQSRKPPYKNKHVLRPNRGLDGLLSVSSKSQQKKKPRNFPESSLCCYALIIAASRLDSTRRGAFCLMIILLFKCNKKEIVK